MNVRQAFGRGGFVAAACLACCAPPIIAALGVTAGLAAAAGVFLGIAAAVAVVLLGVSTIAVRWRRATTCEPTAIDPVAVASPTMRPPPH